MEQGQLWRQYIIAGVANLANLSVGYCLGWSSPISPLLSNGNRIDETPLQNGPASTEQIAWMGSLINVGGFFGPSFVGFFASKIGRKWGLCLTTLPFIIGWILIFKGSSMHTIYVGRICWGIAASMMYTIGPMYCAEISTDECRGAVGSFLQLFTTIGCLLVYTMGPYTSYADVAIVGLAAVIVIAVLFFFLPETPTYHLLKGDPDAAAKSLMLIRGKSRAGVEAELSLIAADVNSSMEKTAAIEDVFKGKNLKAFYISCVLLMLQQFSGINAVLFYMTDIFHTSGLDIAASAPIIIGVVQVIASAMTPFVVDSYGRRLVLLVSTSGSSIGLALLGIFFVLKDYESPLADSFRFVPVVALTIFMISYCWGLGPLPLVIISELFSIEVKTTASPMLTILCSILSFIATKYFPTVAEATSMYVCFLIFFVFCVLAFFFVLFQLPETKGKSFHEIQDMLGGGEQKSVPSSNKLQEIKKKLEVDYSQSKAV